MADNHTEKKVQELTDRLERIEPSKIIVFDKPFDEMIGDIIYVDYLSSRKEAN